MNIKTKIDKWTKEAAAASFVLPQQPGDSIYHICRN